MCGADLTEPVEPTKRTSSFTTIIALAASVIALLAALGSAALSLTALQQANAAKEAAGGTKTADNRGGNNPPAGGQPTNNPPPTLSSPKPSLTGPPVLDERTNYSVKYTKQSLTLTAACNYSMYADLDEPRGNVASNGADLVFHGGCSATDPAEFRVGDDVDAGLVENANATPQECTDRIRRTPVGDAPIPVRQGIAICVTTSYNAARARGDVWRVVLIVVTGVSDLRTVTVETSAWNIPS